MYAPCVHVSRLKRRRRKGGGGESERGDAPPCIRMTRAPCPCRPNAHYHSVDIPSPSVGLCNLPLRASPWFAAARARPSRRPLACPPPVLTIVRFSGLAGSPRGHLFQARKLCVCVWGVPFFSQTLAQKKTVFARHQKRCLTLCLQRWTPDLMQVQTLSP